MNMSMIMRNWVAESISPISMELKPALLGADPWKKAASSRSDQLRLPKVAGFQLSSRNTSRKPSMVRMAEPKSTTLE
ncbi:hypothetical protein D3C87_2073640 [compost metagenome]